MTDRELLQQALNALKHLCLHSAAIRGYDGEQVQTAIDALKARLAQPEPEPVAYLCENAVGHKYFRWKKPQSIFKPIALYTAPPQREWVGLTDEELLDLADMAYANDLELLQTLQAKLKEKNT
jgi:hypothetical protein